MMEHKKHADQVNDKKPAGKRAIFLYQLVIPVLIVAAGVGFLKYQMDTRPRAERTKPARQARLVTVQTVHKQQGTAIVQGMGTVLPSREIVLSPEVTGIITSIDPAVIPGGYVKSGQILYQVDSRDYETLVKQRQSEFAKAQLELKLETGNQTVARQEYDLLQDLIRQEDMELVLRQPQLQSAEQSLQAARAALDKAMLDVQRCSIRAPFNAIIKSRSADLGARVSPQTPLAELTGTDEYWIEVMVPMDQLTWVEVPFGLEQEGSAVRIYNSTVWGKNFFRQGRVIRLLGQLEEKGLMARLLVSVKDPMNLKKPDSLPPLLVGSYVRAEIIGRSVENIIELSRAFVRDGDNVWVMNDGDLLEIRPVKIAYSNRETVFIKDGIEDGHRVITTMISTPVEGMPLRLDSPPQKADTASASSQPLSEAN